MFTLSNRWPAVRPSHAMVNRRKHRRLLVKHPPLFVAEPLEARAYLSGYAFSSLASFVPPGETPRGQLVMDSSGDLFGTTAGGGAYGGGSVFEIAHGSTAITTLASFNGGNPSSGVVLDANGDLFGTTENGGWGYGSVFEIVHGTGAFITLGNFDNTAGRYPQAVALDPAGDVFGTTYSGGTQNQGTVFEIVHGTTAITTLASFNGSNGALPGTSVILDAGGDLFGTTRNGGASNDGTVFEIVHGTTTITTLASFNGSNGENPWGGVTIDASGDLFGTTNAGGANGVGTVFEIANGTTTITTVASFNGANGASSLACVTLDASGDLFGTTYLGGANNDGTIFEIVHGTTNVITLASFNASNGANPDGGVTLDSSGNIFGTTAAGGAYGDYGTVFEIVHGTSALTTLVSFNMNNGQNPEGTLAISSNGDIFGSANLGGVYGNGTLFEINHGTTAITTLANFDAPGYIFSYGLKRGNPEGGVTLDANGDIFGTTVENDANVTLFEILHGTTTINILGEYICVNFPSGVILDARGDIFGVAGYNGPNAEGEVFEIVQGSTAMTALAYFRGTTTEHPVAGLTLDANGDLFGTTIADEAGGYGTVYEIVHGTPGITILAHFNGYNNGWDPSSVTFDADGDLLGTAQNGGAYRNGTVFEIAHGTNTITALASFNGTNGANPTAGVTLDAAGDIFGTTYGGGAYGDGTVFEIVHGTSTITTLVNFNGANGANPDAGLTFDANGDLIGTTEYGGTDNVGTVFELSHVAPTPIFSHLTFSPTISYGTATITFSGTIAAGNVTPLAAETLAITLNGVTQNATIDASGDFTSTFNTSTLPVSATPYQVTYFYAGDANLSGVTDNTTTQLTVNKGTPVFSHLPASPTINYGTATVTFSGTIAAGNLTPLTSEVVAVTLNGVTQNAAINSSGNFSTTFNTSTLPVSATPYQVTYSYAGDANFNSVMDNTTTTLRVNGLEEPVYRLFSPVTKEHLFTSDANESSTLATRGWIYEEVAFEWYNGPVNFDGVAGEPLYRLYDPAIYQHLWTTDMNEYNTLATRGWLQEGIAGYVFPTAVTGSMALYRLSYASPALHMWTTDQNEYDTLANQDYWSQEGVIGYVM